jgi:two-component sensor histidine kinase
MRVMPDKATFAQRHQRIDELHQRAESLMNSQIDTSVKVDVAEAFRDLREARMWLTESRGESSELAELGFADYRIDLAAHRLDFIDDAIKKYGPGVKFIR